MALCLSLATRADAVTTVTATNIDSDSQTPVVTATGLALGLGEGVAAIGYVDYNLLPGIFDDTGLKALNGNLTTQNIAALFGAFQVFAATTASFATLGAFDAPSGFFVAASDRLQAANPTGAPFIGQNIHVMIGNGTTFATSNEVFLFKSIGTPPGDPSIFELENPLPGNPDINISLEFNMMPAQGEILIGDFGLFQSDFGGAAPTIFDAFSLQCAAAVPEPSRPVLLALALGAVILRRRR